MRTCPELLWQVRMLPESRNYERKNKNTFPEQIETLLCNNAEDLVLWEEMKKYGCGFVNVEKIIAAVPAIGGRR